MTTPRELLTEARDAYYGGDFGRARERAEDIADLAADDATQAAALTIRGLCAVRANRDDEGLFTAAAERFAAVPAVDREYVGEYGCALALAGRPADAEPLLRRALEIGAGSGDAWRCMGQVLVAQGDLAAGRRTLSAAQRAFSQDWLIAVAYAEVVAQDSADPRAVAEAWAVAGSLCDTSGRPEVSYDAYGRAVALAPEDINLLMQKAGACAALGAVDEVRELVARAQEIAPTGFELTPLLVVLGNQLLNGEHQDVATDLLHRAIALQPDHARAHAVLGELHRLAGAFDLAVEALDRSVALDPDDAYAIGTRGQVCLATERYDDAIADLERAAALQPGAEWIRYAAGEAYYVRARTDDLDRALAHLGVAHELDPTNVRTLALIGYTHWHRRGADPGSMQAAEDALREAYQIRPDDPNLSYDFGLVLFDAGRYGEALERAEQAYAELPDDPNVRLLRGQALRATGEFDRAIPDLEAAAGALPELGEAHGALGETYRVVGRNEEAMVELGLAVGIDANDGWSLASLGATRQALGDSAAALADLRRSLDLGAEPGFAVWWLCEALSATGDLDAVVTEVAEQAALHPDNPKVQEVYADVLQNAGRHAEAVEVVERALAAEPNHVGLLRSLGWAQFALGDPARATEALERAVEAQPDTNTITDLATIRARGDDVAEALRTIDRGLAVERTSVLLRLRCDVFAGMADWPAAHAAAREAVAVEPVDAYAYWGLGRALRYLGRLPEALEAFQTMRERVPDNPMGPQGAGDVLWSTGRRDEAAPAYQEAIDLYERFGADQAWSRHGVGWCQHRLGRYAEAAETYQLALPASDERSPLLFDIGLNLLAAGESVRAADAYAQGFGVLPAVPRTRVLGMLVAADEDLRVSVEAGIIEDSAQVTDVRDRLAKELEARR
ncbi:MAG TPA: tetratricopeptide repeat protein [Asanoa sp.]|nr:tetratricopeptide repeat protein [Asanoa sp.]